MAPGRRCCQRPSNLIIVVLFMCIAAFQIYLDLKRTSILSQSEHSKRKDLVDKFEQGFLQSDDSIDGLDIEKPNMVDLDLEKSTMAGGLSMKEYTQTYKLSSKMQVCSNLTRPDAEKIYKHKNVYQRFWVTPKGYNTTDAYILSFYYDDRFIYTGAKYIRTFMCIRGIGPERQAAQELIKKTAIWSGVINNTPTHAMLWYEGFANPIASECSTRPAFGITRDVSKVFFYEYIITCALPDIDLEPSHVSIMQHACALPLSTYLPISFPVPPRRFPSRDIGVCMASLYGSMNASDVPYFVSWMEALSIYGVIEVNLNNAMMALDNVMEKVLNYYMQNGRIKYTTYPVMHEKWRDFEQDQATESTNRMHVGDCYFRNLKRYWYTLVIDLDEVPVPMHANTYTEALAEIARKNSSLADAHCHTMRSAFFYFDFPVGNPEYNGYLPLHRHTNRFRIEPMVFGHNDGLGLGKSFHNTRRTVAMGHHLCRSSHEELGVHLLKHSIVTEKDILIHHYRKHCKYTVDCNNKTMLVLDDQIPQTIGNELRHRVEKVYNDLNLDLRTGL